MVKRSRESPRFSQWLLRLVVSADDADSVFGDLEETFDQLASGYDRRTARRWYRSQVFRSWLSFIYFSLLWGPVMFSNYLKFALRNLRKHKGFSFINISGLTVGMACCMLLLLYVHDEISYDTYHENGDRIYRFVDEWAAVGPPYGPAFADDFPNLIDDAVRIYIRRSEMNVRHDDQAFFESGIVFADSGVFNVFTYSMISGDPETALNQPNSVVITETIARKYFGNEDPLGQMLQFWGAEFEVTGVIEDIPSNSHLHFNIMGSMSLLSERAGALMDNWDWGIMYTYILLREDTKIENLTAQLPAFADRHFNDIFSVSAGFQPISSIHLRSDREKEAEPGGNILYVYLLTVIAGIVLLVACVNFTNLTTARAVERSREVGMRKTLGAHRAQLVRQFIGESLLLSLFAVAIAALLVEAALPWFNTISGKELALEYENYIPVLFGFLGIALFVGLVAGSYPAFVLSRFRPAHVLKSGSSVGTTGARLRKSLVVFQFAVSTFLLIGALVVYQQLEFMQNSELGFSKDQVLVMRSDDFSVLRDALLERSDVSNVTSAQYTTGERVPFFALQEAGQPADSMVSMRTLPVDFDYIETMQMEVVAGRSFSRDMVSDANGAFLLNQAAVEHFSTLYDWTDVLGKQLHLEVPGAVRDGEIVGVVKNFNYASLHTEVEPLAIALWPNQRHVFIRLNTENLSETIAGIRAMAEMISPETPFDFSFVDDRLDRLYRAEQRLSSVFGAFTSIAVLIACLGLFGLATFMAERRRKEIGIRKAVGASAWSIVYLFSKDVALLVAISIIIAVPTAYFAVDAWLSRFAYRIPVSAWMFALAAFAAFTIALLSVSYQSMRAAQTNPIDALKYE